MMMTGLDWTGLVGSAGLVKVLSQTYASIASFDTMGQPVVIMCSLSTIVATEVCKPADKHS